MAGGRRVPVFAGTAGYRAAVAALAHSAALAAPADSATGAVVALPGGGWWREVLDAQEKGAAAVVVADPQVAPLEVLDELLEAVAIPLVLERPRVRPDVAAQASEAGAGVTPGAVTVECAATAAEFPAVVRDALGWARLFVGGPLVLRSGTATPQSSMALLEGGPDAGRPVQVPLMANMMTAGRPGGFIRLTSLGEVRVTLTVDVPAGITSVERGSEQGDLRLPSRFEASARLSLRRALDALAAGHYPLDLPGLLHDSRLAAAALRADARHVVRAEVQDQHGL